MASEYYLRESCSKAIATKLAKRALEYVSPEMVAARETLLDAQSKFNEMVEEAAQQMIKRR